MKSILRYPGGKAKLAPIVAQTMAINGIVQPVFVESFCGGASISIALLEKNLVSEVLLNDADPLVAALWRCVFSREDGPWLADQVRRVPLNLDEWGRQKQLVPSTTREAALKCLYLNRTSFNGLLTRRAGPIGGKTQKNRTLDVRFNREALAQGIVELGAYAERVTVSNEDWRAHAKAAARRARAFFYFDPPYFHKAEMLYRHIFDEAQHVAMRDYCLALKRPWMLSYDDTTGIRNLYAQKADGSLRCCVIDKLYSAHPIGGSSFVGRELLYSRLQMPSAETVNTASVQLVQHVHAHEHMGEHPPMPHRTRYQRLEESLIV